MARQDYAIAGPPDLTAEQFAAILRAGGSLALPEAGAMHAALVAAGVRPAAFLAFFWVESKFGAVGIAREYDTRNPGNVRTPEVAGAATAVIDTPRGRFAKYPTWAAGTRDWAARMLGPKYAGRGLTTVRGVLPVYAPASDGNAPEAYIAAVLARIDQWVPESTGKGPSVAPLIAISAGHRNKQRGDAFEMEQTGPLARAVGDACAALGMRVVHLTPDDGLGMSPLSLDAVAAQVTRLSPRPDIYLETHTEGGGGTGVFAIYPDAPGDVDTDVRDRLGPLVARAVAAATGLGLRRGGVISERETGVGADGSRLGVFRATAPVKADVTRLIIEYGAHDKEPDLTIASRPGFAERCGQATAAAFAAFLGWRAPDTADKGPVPAPSADPGFPGALQPDGTSQLNGVDFGGTLVRVEWVELGGVNAAGERYRRKWAGHALAAWEPVG